MKNRHSLRSHLRDYNESGGYFVPICVNEGAELFGSVKGELILNDAGKMIESVWQQVPKRFPTADLDRHVVMPNHFHAIIILGMDNIHGQCLRLKEQNNPALGEIVGAFKSNYYSGIHKRRARIWLAPFQKPITATRLFRSRNKN
jgi:hypothetical protein